MMQIVLETDIVHKGPASPDQGTTTTTTTTIMEALEQEQQLVQEVVLAVVQEVVVAVVEVFHLPGSEDSNILDIQ